MSKIKLTPELRKELDALYKGVRVADVRDGLDWYMMHHYGSMSPNIRPLYRTLIMGYARTVRYVRFEHNVPHMTPEEYDKWVSWYYQDVGTEPWNENVQDGDIPVLDCAGDCTNGVIGSANGLRGVLKGIRGYISNGAYRDTDELVIQKIPCWCAHIGQGMIQARLRVESFDITIDVGGVQVNPGDIVVADGDGVIVVPLDMAHKVGEKARSMNIDDRAGRGKIYRQAGIKLDSTVD